MYIVEFDLDLMSIVKVDLDLMIIVYVDLNLMCYLTRASYTLFRSTLNLMSTI